MEKEEVDKLNASGYRVLRHIDLCPIEDRPPNVEVRDGLFVDCETTGLDPMRHEIIELAMLPFAYDGEGRVFRGGTPFHRFRQPSHPIPAEITRLTGITNEKVAGMVIDPDEVAAFIDSAALIVAHNAFFDRRFLERFCNAFVKKPWACSMSQIDWMAEGCEGLKLSYLLMEAGLFHDRHGALSDCCAGLKLLSTKLPKSGVYAMGQLLQKARVPSWRIYAERAPFEIKDTLKARGYCWDVNRRVWHIDVEDAARDQELEFLGSLYYRQAELPMHKINAYNRFSEPGRGQ